MGLPWLPLAVLLAPVVTPESDVDPPLSGPAFRLDRAPATAWAGDSWLSVWQHVGLGGPELRAGRVTADGTARDPFATLVAAGEASLPAIACASTSCLVAWIGGEPATLWAARVGLDGAAIGDPWELAPPPIAPTQWPSVASDGAGWLIVWGGDFGAIRVDADGTVLDPGGLPVFAQGTDVSVAAGDGAYLILWVDAGQVRGRRVTTDGAVLDATPIAISLPGSPALPSAAWHGGAWLVAWDDGVQSRIRAARVAGDGVPLDAPVDLTDNTRWRMAPVVAAGPDGWLVAWFDACGLYASAARIAPDGTLLDPIAIQLAAEIVGWDGVPRSGRPGASAAPSGEYAVIWSAALPGHDPVDGFHAQLARVDPVDGSVLDATPILVGSGANAQRDPAVAASADRFLVAWTDYRGGIDADLFGSLRGAEDVGPGVSFAIAARPGNQIDAAAARLGDRWLVAFGDTGAGPQPDVLAVLLDSDGMPLGPDRVVASGTGSQRPLAATGLATGALVLIDDRGELDTLFVDAGGAVTPFTGLPPATPSTGASLAGLDGVDAALVAWVGGDGVYGARIAGGAAPGARRLGDAQPGTLTAVAAAGSTGLVVWTRGDEIVGCLVGSDGAPVSSPFPVTSAAPSTKPVVAFDGTWFVVVGARVAFVSPSGAVDERPLSLEAEVIACVSNACALARDTLDPSFHVERARVQTLVPSPAVPPDAGVPTADAAPGDAAPVEPVPADCGCRAGSRTSSRGGWLVVLGAALLLIRRVTTSYRRGGG